MQKRHSETTKQGHSKRATRTLPREVFVRLEDDSVDEASTTEGWKKDEEWKLVGVGCSVYSSIYQRKVRWSKGKYEPCICNLTSPGRSLARKLQVMGFCTGLYMEGNRVGASLSTQYSSSYIPVGQ